MHDIFFILTAYLHNLYLPTCNLSVFSLLHYLFVQTVPPLTLEYPCGLKNNVSLILFHPSSFLFTQHRIYFSFPFASLLHGQGVCTLTGQSPWISI